MTRHEKLIAYLDQNNFSYSAAELGGGSGRSKVVCFLQKGDEDFVLSFIPRSNPELEKKMKNESLICAQLSSAGLKNTPEYYFVSDENYFSIRKKLEGEVSGNVYSFGREILKNQNLIDEMEQVLIALQKVKVDGIGLIDSDFIREKLTEISKKHPDYSGLSKKLIAMADKFDLDNQSQKVFLHGDIQPTNILFLENGEFALIDYESAAYGNCYYDWASLYHRGETYTDWQAKLFDIFQKIAQSSAEFFDQELFDFFRCYYLFLDLVSLESKYVSGQGAKFHNTELKVDEARKLAALYREKLNEFQLP